MLVDLARMTTGRGGGHVEIDFLRQIRYYSHVIHMVSRVKAAPDLADVFSLFCRHLSCRQHANRAQRCRRGDIDALGRTPGVAHMKIAIERSALLTLLNKRHNYAVQVSNW